MQKSPKNASIFIWAIFLSMMISIFFIWISSQIRSLLEEQSNKTADFYSNQSLQYTINNNNFDDSQIDEKTSITYDNSWFFHLQKNEKLNIFFPNTSTINITTQSWSTLLYSSGSTVIPIANNYSDTVSWNISLTNISGYNIISINSNQKFIPETLYYEVHEKIWNKQIIQTLWEIKNF